MELLITVVVAVLIFALLWWLITLLPLPAGFPPHIKTVLFVILILVAVFWLWSKFLR